MKTLAVEFSTNQRAVAVLDGGHVLGVARETATRATHAIRLIETVLAEAKIEREAIECLAIGLGPGSYTGIRAALALAQGWQLALGPKTVKLLGVGSMECLANEARERGWFGKINFVVDAQRQELYLAAYEITRDACVVIEPLRLVPIQAAQLRAESGEVLAGPEVSRWVPSGRELFPTATALGRLAEGRDDYSLGENLEPIYLRETTFVKAPPSRHVPTH